jgi:hypothetical protein
MYFMSLYFFTETMVIKLTDTKHIVCVQQSSNYVHRKRQMDLNLSLTIPIKCITSFRFYLSQEVYIRRQQVPFFTPHTIVLATVRKYFTPRYTVFLQQCNGYTGCRCFRPGASVPRKPNFGRCVFSFFFVLSGSVYMP